MPVDEAAVKAYLARVPADLPAFKGATEEQLRLSIYNSTGAWWKPHKTDFGEGRIDRLEGLAFALYMRRCLLFYGMRMGKSWMAVNYAQHLRDAGLWKPGMKGLIVAHAPIGIEVWEDQVAQHCDLKAIGVHKAGNDFCDALESDADLIIVPTSGLQVMFSSLQKVKKYNGNVVNELVPDWKVIDMAAPYFDLMIADEVHLYKNPDTLRFRIVNRMVKYCQFRLGLTGTPFGRNPFDVWAQTYLVDQGKVFGTNFKMFQVAYGLPRKNPWTNRLEYKFDKRMQKQLESWLRAISLSYRLEEVQRLNIIKNVVHLHMAPEQQAAYENAVHRLMRISEWDVREIKNTFVRLRQISSGFLPFSDDEDDTKHVMRFPHNPKLDWLRDTLETMDEKMQIVIFHEYTYTGRMIADLLEKMKIRHEWLHGGMRNAHARIVSQFHSGKIRVLVIQSAVGSTSIDLPQADYLLFFESPSSPVIRAQAEARPLARGERLLVMDDIIVSETERHVLNLQKEGKDLMTSIVHRDRESLLAAMGGKEVYPKQRRISERRIQRKAMGA